MIFSSIVFLFLFLPFALLTYYLVPFRLRNFMLLCTSLLFYFWGGREYILVLLFSIAVDYVCGWIQMNTEDRSIRKRCVQASLVINLGMLLYFKYTGFFVENINLLLGGLSVTSLLTAPEIVLPVGISFYTFQTLSYQIDLYYGRVRHQRSLIDFSLFVAMFPQLVAGPIIRYHEIEQQIARRVTALSDFSYGIFRFVVGLAKKVLIADPLGSFADYAFSRPAESLPCELAWLGALSFSLQIYADFSAYSDMAIGLGRMFGFRFPENFRYPFTARNVHEFWQRWHITLTTWFRDYLYSWLKDAFPGRTMKSVHTMIVFVIVGFWHGASWTFIVWGLFYGILLVLERKGLKKVVGRFPVPFQHVYLLFIVMISSIFFRSRDMSQAITMLGAMFGANAGASLDPMFFLECDGEFVTQLVVACLGSAAVFSWMQHRCLLLAESWKNGRFAPALQGVGICAVLLVFCCSVASLVAGVQSPFIYFQF